MNDNEQQEIDPIVEKVIERLRSRSKIGIKKYGTTLDKSKDDFLEHLLEELLDAANYVQKLIEEREKKEK